MLLNYFDKGDVAKDYFQEQFNDNVSDEKKDMPQALYSKV